AHDSSGGEDDGIILIRDLLRRSIASEVKARLSVGEVEGTCPLRDGVVGAGLEEPRSAGVILRRAGPENAHLSLDLLPNNAVVVTDPALARDSQLFEDFPWSGKFETVIPAHGTGDVLDDLPVLPGLS